MNIRRYIFLAAAMLLLSSFSVSFSLFMTDYMEDYGDAPYADAVVVLTGGVGRAEEGLRLFREGKGGLLIISGVEEGSRLNAIFPGKNLEKTVDTSRIILDRNSRSTIANAMNVKMIIEGKGVKSLTLVTSNYHTKRAYSIFRKVIKGDVVIYRHPVDGPNFRTVEWWRDPNSIRIVLNEYLKYCWFQLWQRSVSLQA